MIHQLHVTLKTDADPATETISARCPCGWSGQPRTAIRGNPASTDAALVALRDEHTAYVEAQET